MWIPAGAGMTTTPGWPTPFGSAIVTGIAASGAQTYKARSAPATLPAGLQVRGSFLGKAADLKNGGLRYPLPLRFMLANNSFDLV